MGRKWVAVLIPLLILLFVYHQAGSLGLVWDDKVLAGNNQLLRGDNWLHNIWSSLIFQPNYFRPLVLASWVLDARLFDQVITGMHWGNVLLRGANTLLVGILAQRFSRMAGMPGGAGVIAALIASAIYACHPALVESTVWISGRFDLLVTTWMLLGLLAISSLSGAKRDFALMALFFAAALSKEYAVIFPCVILCWLLAAESVSFSLQHLGRFMKRHGQLLVLFLVSGLIYLLVRYFSLGFLILDAGFKPMGSPLQHLLMAGKTFLAYLHLSLWPFGISSPLHETQWPLAIDDPAGWLGLFALLSTCVGLHCMIRSERWRPFGWLLMMILIAYLPVLNLFKAVPIENNFAAERFMTFPLAITCIAMGAAIASRIQSLTGIAARLTVVALLCWSLPAALVSNQNASFWRSDLYLWSWVINEKPTSSSALLNLSAAYVAEGDPELVLLRFRRLLASWGASEYPNFSGLFSGQLPQAMDESDLRSSLALLEAGLAEKPDRGAHMLIFQNYATLLNNTGRHQEALLWLRMLDHQEANQVKVLAAIAKTQAALGQLDEAAAYMHRALAVEPDNQAYAKFLEDLMQLKRDSSDLR